LPLTSTNNPNYTVKATATDNGPGILNAKIRVAGSLTKTLSTNAGAVSITLSNSATAAALDNENVHIGLDGSCGFGLQGVPIHINPNGDFDRLSIGEDSEHSFNGDGSFSLANGTFTSDTAGNLTAHAFATAGDIEITDTAKGVILR